MIPGKFDYHRPSRLSDAVGLMMQLGDESRVIAGGQTLLPMMKLRLATPAHLIDLQNIAALRGVRVDADAIVIGAMTTQAELIGDATLGEICPILREAALQIADPQVRNLGTIGGNVANGDPGNDMPALMQCLGAAFVLTGLSGFREVPARDFYELAFVTKARDAEILSAIRVPVPARGHGYAYEKQKRKIGDYATAAAAVLLTVANGRCETASIALTNLADTPLWAEAAAKALEGTSLDAAAIAAAASAAVAITDPAADARGDAAFKKHVAGIVIRRAIQRAAERAKG